MKTQSLLSGFLLVLLSGGAPVLGQGPVNPATNPAKPPVIAPAEGKPTEGKQVDVPAPAAVPPADNVAPDVPASGTPGDTKQSAKDRRAPYIIGPEDILMIKVWQEPNLSGQVTVGPDGMISLQLIDEVKADGLTPEQLKASLTKKLKAFITDPDVNVQVLRVNSRKFIIQGEVNRTGSFPLTGPTTVMEALVYAGGFREFANTKKIYILRTELDPKTGKSETKKFTFNYKEVSHGRHMEQNILVLNGDQIYVP